MSSATSAGPFGIRQLCGNLIAGADGSFLQDFRKNALPGHDTVAHAVADGTALMALLADLRHPEHDRAAADNRSDGKIFEINALYKKVLAEVSVHDLCAAGVEFLYLVIGQETYLTMPLAGMGVVFNSEVFDKKAFADRSLFRSLCRAGADRTDNAFHNDFL